MKRDSQKLAGEVLQKEFNTLIKAISDDELRDMLAILYSEPELAIYNIDLDQLTKEEKERYQSERAKMTYFGQWVFVEDFFEFRCLIEGGVVCSGN